MLGRHHLTLSVGTVALVVLPLFTLFPNEVLVVLVGTAVGSLIPDADSPDAAIFHPEVRGLEGGFTEILNAAAIVFPAFGYVTRYLIYKPAVLFFDRLVFDEYDVAERHRGFLHSFLGLGTLTVLSAVYLLPVLFLLGLLWIPGILLFMAGYLGGAVLHLVEDSCTKTGIQWNFPFQGWRVKGQITTTAKSEDMRYQRGLLTVLGVGVAGAFLVPSVVTAIPRFTFSIGGFVLAVLVWLVFAKAVAKCAVYPG